MRGPRRARASAARTSRSSSSPVTAPGSSPWSATNRDRRDRGEPDPDGRRRPGGAGPARPSTSPRPRRRPNRSATSPGTPRPASSCCIPVTRSLFQVRSASVDGATPADALSVTIEKDVLGLVGTPDPDEPSYGFAPAGPDDLAAVLTDLAGPRATSSTSTPVSRAWPTSAERACGRAGGSGLGLRSRHRGGRARGCRPGAGAARRGQWPPLPLRSATRAAAKPLYASGATGPRSCHAHRPRCVITVEGASGSSALRAFSPDVRVQEEPTADQRSGTVHIAELAGAVRGSVPFRWGRDRDRARRGARPAAGWRVRRLCAAGPPLCPVCEAELPGGATPAWPTPVPDGAGRAVGSRRSTRAPCGRWCSASRSAGCWGWPSRWPGCWPRPCVRAAAVEPGGAGAGPVADRARCGRAATTPPARSRCERLAAAGVDGFDVEVRRLLRLRPGVVDQAGPGRDRAGGEPARFDAVHGRRAAQVWAAAPRPGPGGGLRRRPDHRLDGAGGPAGPRGGRSRGGPGGRGRGHAAGGSLSSG